MLQVSSLKLEEYNQEGVDCNRQSDPTDSRTHAPKLYLTLTSQVKSILQHVKYARFVKHHISISYAEVSVFFF